MSKINKKVLHLATSLQGGAGVAAYRTHSALLKLGVNSSIRSLNGGEGAFGDLIVEQGTLRRLKSSFLTYFQYKWIQNSAQLVTPKSLDRLNLGVLKDLSFDVIHVHAFYNLLSLGMLQKLEAIGKPIFITMHDERIFTGGCHYTGQCENFKSECRMCPQVHKIFQSRIFDSHKEALEILQKTSNTYFLSPSLWLANEASKSSTLKNKSIAIIRNPIPDPYEEFSARSQTKQAISKSDLLRVGFCSANLNNPYKGLNVLISALNELAQRSPSRANQLHVTFVGHGQISGLSKSITYQTVTADTDDAMANVLSELDTLIVPSLQDNSPNVVGEALRSGTPVIGSKAGGIPELLENYGHQVFPIGDSYALSKILESISKKSLIDSAALQIRARNEFGEITIAKKLNDLYEAALKN